MKILYVGSIVPEDLSLQIKDNSLAGNRFQTNFINKLRKKATVDIVSFVAVYIDSHIQKELDIVNDSSNDKYFYKGNHWILNIIKFRNYIKKVIKDYDAVITYNVQYPWFNLPRFSKKTKSLLFLADFSDVDSYSSLLMKLYAQISKKDFKKYSIVVGLSENTKNYLTNKQKFIYIPGGIDLTKYNNTFPTKINKKIKIMYSGLLSKVTGIDMLIDAVNNINMSNVELIITGRGDMQEYVSKKSDGKRIKYLGSLEYEDYLKVLNSANILINPRNMNLPENANNFPSKVLDYLAVGKMVVSTKFSGYNNFKNNFYFCDSNVDSMQKTIIKVMNEYESNYINVYNRNTKKAVDYSWDVQIEKIYRLLKK